MADRQFPLSFFAPWSEPYAVPSSEEYPAVQQSSSPREPTSWATAMGSRAWQLPIFMTPTAWDAGIFPSESWPGNANTGVAGGAVTLPEGRPPNAASTPPNGSAQPSSGILPSDMTDGPRIPNPSLPGSTYQAQPTYTPESPPNWRGRVADALSEENVRYSLGPGFYDFYRELAGLAEIFSPGPGVKQGIEDASNAQRALQDGDLGQGLIDYGKSAANLGVSILPEGGPLLGKATMATAKAIAGSKAIFAGILAKIARLDRLERAKSMQLAGKSANQIYFETGWFHDLDGNWKFELPDHEIYFTGHEGVGVGGPNSLVQHPILKEAYPDLQHVRIAFSPELSRGDGVYANFSGGAKPTAEKPAQIRLPVGPPWETPGIAVHELQHGVQDIENFGRYGTPLNAYDPVHLERAKDLLRRADQLRSQGDAKAASTLDYRAISVLQSATNFDNYMRLAGEIEARNAQTRALMTPEQRLAKPPWETADPDGMPPIVRTRVPPQFPQDEQWLSYQRLILALREMGLL